MQTHKHGKTPLPVGYCLKVNLIESIQHQCVSFGLRWHHLLSHTMYCWHYTAFLFFLASGIWVISWFVSFWQLHHLVQCLVLSEDLNTFLLTWVHDWMIKGSSKAGGGFYRDGQSGKITVDDYGARTGKSPGMMRQLNINGALYVGKWPWPPAEPQLSSAFSS